MVINDVQKYRALHTAIVNVMHSVRVRPHIGNDTMIAKSF
jgi:hypothetical protein